MIPGDAEGLEPETALLPNQLYCLSDAKAPSLELLAPADGRSGVDDRGVLQRLPMKSIGPGRTAREALWSARLPPARAAERRRFRIATGHKSYLQSSDGGDRFETSFETIWLQDGELFAYRPAARPSASRVRKYAHFAGSLPERPVYVYTPRGYTEHEGKRYPVLYMHDGQNCFEAFAGDSFAGSWKADQIADALIAAGRIPECLILAVGHGGDDRIREYLPPAAVYRVPPAELLRNKGSVRGGPGRAAESSAAAIFGHADRTAAFYRDEVAPYFRRRYRMRSDREQIATCGSSMGGLFSFYLAWQFPDFARNHAALSPAFGMARDRSGKLKVLDRIGERPRGDIRLWLDSGTRTSEGRGDDGWRETLAVRKALRDLGIAEGCALRYCLDRGAEHSEEAWSRRLPHVLEFLFDSC